MHLNRVESNGTSGSGRTRTARGVARGQILALVGRKTPGELATISTRLPGAPKPRQRRTRAWRSASAELVFGMRPADLGGGSSPRERHGPTDAAEVTL